MTFALLVFSGLGDWEELLKFLLPGWSKSRPGVVYYQYFSFMSIICLPIKIWLTSVMLVFLDLERSYWSFYSLAGV